MNIDSVNTVAASSPPARSEAPRSTTRDAIPASAQASESSGRAVTSQSEQGKQPDNVSNAPSRDEVEGAVSRLSKFVAPNQSEINFSVDESSGIRVVKIIDRNSNEVIRQMPSEEAVALARALDKLQSLLIKDKA